VADRVRVLIVEDEGTLADNLRQYLQSRGWDAVAVRTGGLAIAASATFQPGIVLLDYHLPDMDGFAALGAIRATHACRCVLMTGHPVEEITEGVTRHGIRHVLHKPFSLAEMEGSLFRVLSEHAGPTDQRQPNTRAER
jgi:DNA-binding response OmpR family regulator